MTYPIKMPQLGETVIEGTIIRWLKGVGDSVAVDEPLFEISTDKVDTEVPSAAAGVLRRIIVAEGETVGVGTVIAELDADASAPSGAAPAETAETSAPSAAATEAASRPPGHEPLAAVVPPEGGGARGQVLSPVVRKLAAEHSVDLSQVRGTGDGGRITKKDVESYLATKGGSSAPTTATPSPPGVPAPAGPREELVPITHIRQAIAEHMHRSLQVSARAWNMVEIDLGSVTQLLASTKDALLEREGFKLTYTPFVARAACEALMQFPMVNAELREDGILMRRYVNLGIAVSYEDGLIVPVVKDAAAMNTAGLARAINDLAVRARAKRLQPDEVHGGTFSITNPGPFGSILSVPIINQPQSAILAFDAVQKRPVVIDDAIAIRHMVYMSMSWDHRVIDGALASRFLARVKENLEGFDFGSDLGI